jgi:flagellar hook-length control protein FliK
MNMPFMIQNLFDLNVAGNVSKAGQCTSGKTSVAGVFAALMEKVQNAGRNTAKMTSSSPPVALKGHALIAQLKKNLLSSGAALDQITADDSALNAIEKVLVGAGFEAGQVKTLLGELKSNAGGNGVKVSSLFEGISRLSERATANPKPAYLEISALPFIETLLAKFALTPDQIKTALSTAKVEGKGIDAEKLASELKRIQQGAGSTKNIVEDDTELDQIASMMQQIGLTASIDRTAPFDLERLVASLQQFGSRKTSQIDSGAKVMTSATARHQAIFKPLQSVQSLSTFAPEGLLPSNGVASKLEMAPGLQDIAAGDQRQTGDWGLFVQHLHPVASRNVTFPERKAGSLFPPNDTSHAALFAGMDATTSQTGSSNSVFSGSTLFQPLFKREAIKAGVSAHTNPEKASMASVVRSGEQSVDALVGTGKAVRKFVDSSIPFSGSGVAPLTETKLALASVVKSDEQSVDALVGARKVVRKFADSSISFFGNGISYTAETSNSTRISTSPPPAGRMFPQYLLDQVSRQILRSHLANDSEIQIQLKPPSLGRLKISIEHKTEGLKVSIIAESQSARDMLLSNSGDLKTALLEQGINLDRINVETQTDFNQTMANTGHGSQGSDGRKRSFDSNRIRVETITSEIEISLAQQSEASGVNLLA